IQIFAVGLAWMLCVAFRRRGIVPREVPRRRSRHEVIDAMASMYLRAGDVEGGWRKLAHLSRLRIARAIGIGASATSTERVAQAIAMRAGERPAEELRAVLARGQVGSRRTFVERAQRLRALRVGLDEHGGRSWSDDA